MSNSEIITDKEFRLCSYIVLVIATVLVIGAWITLCAFLSSCEEESKTNKISNVEYTAMIVMYENVPKGYKVKPISVIETRNNTYVTYAVSSKKNQYIVIKEITGGRVIRSEVIYQNQEKMKHDK